MERGGRKCPMTTVLSLYRNVVIGHYRSHRTLFKAIPATILDLDDARANANKYASKLQVTP